MNDIPVFLSAPLLTVVFLEIVKWIVRNWVLKNPTFDFAPIFYEYTIPFFNAGFGILLGLLGFAPPVLFDWMELLNWGLAIAFSLLLYNFGVKPFKMYRENLKYKL